MGRNRWSYMAAPGFNPPNADCAACRAAGTSPSRTFHVGDKRVADTTHRRWRCEHGHVWVVVESAESDPR